VTSTLDDGLVDDELEVILEIEPDRDDDSDGGDEEKPKENYYPNVYAFVDFLAQMFAHDLEGQTEWRWCPDWFAHTEAIARLESCWKAFEVLRLDPGTGSSVWFRDHADPCMAALTNPTGPFARCSPEKGHRPQPWLPVNQPPAFMRNAGAQVIPNS
jgi:hypothetical protein